MVTFWVENTHSVRLEIYYNYGSREMDDKKKGNRGLKLNQKSFYVSVFTRNESELLMQFWKYLWPWENYKTGYAPLPSIPTWQIDGANQNEMDREWAHTRERETKKNQEITRV